MLRTGMHVLFYLNYDQCMVDGAMVAIPVPVYIVAFPSSNKDLELSECSFETVAWG